MGMIREFLWSIAKFALDVLDLAYSFLYDLATLKIFDFPVVKQWYLALCGIVVFFVVVRIVAMYFSDMIKEDTPMQIKLTPIEILIRISVISLVIFITPDLFGYISDVGVSFIENINLITTTSTSLQEFEPSSVIIENMIIDTSIEDIVINKKQAGQYVISTTEIFWAIALGAGGAVAMILIALQVTQRFLGLAFKLVIAPFPISSLVNHQSQTFRQWTTLCVSDVISNAGQFLFLLLILAINSSSVLEQLLPNPIVKAIFFVGSCLAVLTAPSGIAQLFGNDFGAASSLQSLNTMKMLGGMVKGGLGIAAAGAGFAGGSLMTAGAGVVSGASNLYGATQDAGGIQNAMMGGGMQLMKSALGFGGSSSSSNVNESQGINSNVQSSMDTNDSSIGNQRVSESLGTYTPFSSNTANNDNLKSSAPNNDYKQRLQEYYSRKANSDISKGDLSNLSSMPQKASQINGQNRSQSRLNSSESESTTDAGGMSQAISEQPNVEHETSSPTVSSPQSVNQISKNIRNNPIKNVASFAGHTILDASHNRWRQSTPARAVDKTISTMQSIGSNYKNFVKANEFENTHRGEK